MRKPTLNSWKMLNIKAGTSLFRKGEKKSICKTISEETMELELQDGKKKIRKFGLVKAEQHMREKDGAPKKRCDGWDYWGVMEGDKWTAVYDIYAATDRDTLVERAK